MRLINADECINEIKRRERIVEVRRTEAIDPNLDHEIFTEREYWNGIFCTFEETIDVIDNMNSWISVKDRLPECGEIVLFTGRNAYGNQYITQRGYYDGEYGGAWKRDGDDRRYSCNYVSHWMPLPEPPKEVENAAD